MPESVSQQPPEPSKESPPYPDFLTDAKKGEPFAKFVENCSFSAIPYIGAGIWLIKEGDWQHGVTSLSIAGGIVMTYFEMYRRYSNAPAEKKEAVKESLYRWGERVRRVRESNTVKRAGGFKESFAASAAKRADDFTLFLENDLEHLPSNVIKKEFELIEKIFSGPIALAQKMNKKLDEMAASQETRQSEKYGREKVRVRKTVASYARKSGTDLKLEENYFSQDLQHEIDSAMYFYKEGDKAEIDRELTTTAIGELITEAKKAISPTKSQFLRLVARRLFLDVVKREEKRQKTKIDPVWVNGVARRILYSGEDLGEEFDFFVKSPPLEAEFA